MYDACDQGCTEEVGLWHGCTTAVCGSEEVVVWEGHSASEPEVHGLTIDYTSPPSSAYRATDFALQTYWDEFLAALASTNYVPTRVCITNVVGHVVSTSASQYIAGTNTSAVVGGSGTLPLGNWNFTAPLSPGCNVITVTGTNTAGNVDGDMVTVFKATAPAVAANAGYILILPEDHPGIKLTGIGMVQTNNAAMGWVPYSSVPWAGLSFDVTLDMRTSGVTNLFAPPQKYSQFNYDYLMAQEPLGGSPWYAEYFIDDWGGRTTNFFPSVTGADRFEPGKGYLIFFSTGRSASQSWTCTKPY